MKRIRKALGAGVSAAVLAGGTALQNNGVPTSVEGWAGLAGLAVSAFIVAAVLTYAVRNESTSKVEVNAVGSDA